MGVFAACGWKQLTQLIVRKHASDTSLRRAKSVRSVIYVCLLILVSGFTCANAQTSQQITIILKDGPLLVDEVTEESDGYWYKRGNMSKFLDRERVIRIEPPKPPAEENTDSAKSSEGSGKWR